MDSIFSDMTYNVFGGTLNPTQSILESGGHIDTIYSDFEEAFDKFPHRRLISKLHTYGVHDTRPIINGVCDF